MPRTYPLTPPATPIALCPNNLLSPPPDRLIDAPTTLSITRETPGRAFTVHLIRAHEPLDSPDRYTLLFTVSGKPWPTQHRQICDAAGVPVLELRRVWMGSRRWAVRDLLEASMPWSGGGSGSGSGSTGFKLDVKLWNVLGAGDSDTGSRVHSSDPIPEPVFNSETGSRRGVGDEPPPYASVAGDEEEYQDEEAEIWRNEKRSPFPTSEDQFSPEPTRRERDQDSHIVLPSYASVRRNSSNSIRDLLDAIEPPNEPAPAPSSSSLQTPTLLSAGISSGSKVDLQVMQLTASGIGVMMADQKIIHIARHNVIDYGRSGIKSKWEAEVAEGVDLLLAVNIVLIMASSA
ncbi:uncharacterized protein N7511_005895 [Penicillium nucicola]|uniref:uncharacterized protein n=1 Tax=Penicillium nucicola TaxID=1850975 RepID=UPI0025457EF8|nr:uncharacterized protein N7511_005895 [Penicillium nucicola]KAJ5762513.1 hypothetical protein N7511_005895 [Penicillium nucicola]